MVFNGAVVLSQPLVVGSRSLVVPVLEAWVNRPCANSFKLLSGPEPCPIGIGAQRPEAAFLGSALQIDNVFEIS